MKKNILLASLLLCGSISCASEVKNDTFIGLEVGKAKFTTTASSSYYGSETESVNEEYLSLRLGKVLDKGRVLASLIKYNTESGVSASSITGGYDYFLSTTSSFKPYIGANVGLAFRSFGDTSLDGFVYGVGIGGLISINDTTDIDIGLKYNLSTQNDSDDSYCYEDFDIDSVVKLGVAINFYF
ncbi:MAG: hypothetical protein U9P72_02060 [Campylobacterota bacterium]|nr:hypothetical protein [Campylobacterota bacterium]